MKQEIFEQLYCSSNARIVELKDNKITMITETGETVKITFDIENLASFLPCNFYFNPSSIRGKVLTLEIS